MHTCAHTCIEPLYGAVWEKSPIPSRISESFNRISQQAMKTLPDLTYQWWFISHAIHVWYIYPYLSDFYDKFRWIHGCYGFFGTLPDLHSSQWHFWVLSRWKWNIHSFDGVTRRKISKKVIWAMKKNPGCLGFIGDYTTYTTQLYGEYKDVFWGLRLNTQYNGKYPSFFFVAHLDISRWPHSFWLEHWRKPSFSSVNSLSKLSSRRVVIR